MSVDDDEFAGAAQRMLAAYRSEEALPDDVRARVRARLVASDAVRPVAPVVHGGTRWAIAGMAVAAALAAIWWGRDQLVREVAPTPSQAASAREAVNPPTPVQAREPAAITPSTALTSEVQPASEPRPVSPTPEAKPPRPRAIAPSEVVDDATTREVDGLTDEAELLRTAQAALARGEGRRALTLLDAGALRFPRGVLLEERAALHVLALCELGRRTDARGEADAFVAAHPRSPLLARVRSACSDTPPP